MGKEKPLYFRAKEGFGTVFDGAPVHVAAGEIVRAGHPILRRREDLFEPVTSFGRFDVEQASAAPAEKRGRRSAPAEAPEPEPEPEPVAGSGLKTTSFNPTRTSVE
jgi:hypothetical protein